MRLAVVVPDPLVGEIVIQLATPPKTLVVYVKLVAVAALTCKFTELGVEPLEELKESDPGLKVKGPVVPPPPLTIITTG